MKKIILSVLVFGAVALVAPRLCALSETLHRPSLFFPKGYDTNRAERVLSVLRSNRFEYRDGMTSYWPPDWSTTLVYVGNAANLRTFIAALAKVDGMSVRVTYSDNLSKESGSALRSGSWWVKYSHAMPNTLTIRVNQAANGMSGEEFEANLPK